MTRNQRTNKYDNEFFPKIINKTDKSNIKVSEIEIEGYNDEPGLHWSNPGIKKVIINTSFRKKDWRI